MGGGGAAAGPHAARRAPVHAACRRVPLPRHAVAVSPRSSPRREIDDAGGCFNINIRQRDARHQLLHGSDNIHSLNNDYQISCLKLNKICLKRYNDQSDWLPAPVALSTKVLREFPRSPGIIRPMLSFEAGRSRCREAGSRERWMVVTAYARIKLRNNKSCRAECLIE